MALIATSEIRCGEGIIIKPGTKVNLKDLPLEKGQIERLKEVGSLADERDIIEKATGVKVTDEQPQADNPKA